ncbi:MAG TPA: hypothetical protein VK427_05635, partial [Kofleriaceae bacterium]|nr:hypothetical protein [Kofleriaceae bacterium]
IATAATGAPADADDTAATGAAGVTETVPPAVTNVRGPYVSVALAMDVGFRNFTYAGATTANLTPEKEGGQVLLGPVVELWPGTLAGMRVLRGLSLYLRFGYGVNSQAVEQRATMMTTSAKTFWRSFEASLRHRWTIKDVMTVEVGSGFVRDQHQFEGQTTDIDLVPDADYKSMRLGVRASALLGKIEPYAAIENRLVLSGGTIEGRFDDASASGLRAAGGAEVKLGAIAVRVEGALVRYAWSFTSNETSDKFRATGGTDSIKYITASVGYVY